MQIQSRKLLQIGLGFIIFYSMLSTWMWWVAKTIPAQPPVSDGDLYKGVARETNPWLEPWQRWDTPHYQAIAQRGYLAFDTALFTPPLYPLLMHLFAPLFGGNDLAAGLFISGLAFVGCLTVLQSLTLQEFGEDQLAWRAVIYITIFPTAFFFVAAYNESLYLLMVLLGFQHIKRGNWLAAGIFSGLAACTRLPGVLLVIPISWAAWQAYRSGGRSSWIAPMLTILGGLLYPLYVWLFMKLSPLKILEALNARGGYLTIPGRSIVEAIKRILNNHLAGENIMELFFTLFLIVMSVFAWKKLPRIYGIYSITMTLFFLARFGSPQPLVSMTRYTIEVFPLFLVLAIWGKNTWVNRVILYLSLLGLLYFAGQFALWGWVG